MDTKDTLIESLKKQAEFDAGVLNGSLEYDKNQIIKIKKDGVADILEINGDNVKQYLKQGWRTASPEEVYYYDKAKKGGALAGAALGAFNVVDTA